MFSSTWKTGQAIVDLSLLSLVERPLSIWGRERDSLGPSLRFDPSLPSQPDSKEAYV